MKKNRKKPERTERKKGERRLPPAARPTAPAKVAAHLKQLQALELRAAGVSFDKIAEALGYKSRSGAFEAVRSALDKTLQEPADRVRKMEVERLNRLWLGAWPRASAGDTDAISACLRIMKRRAELEGLDALRSHEVKHSGKVGVDHAGTIAARIEADPVSRELALQLLERVGASPAESGPLGPIREQSPLANGAAPKLSQP